MDLRNQHEETCLEHLQSTMHDVFYLYGQIFLFFLGILIFPESILNFPIVGIDE